MIEATPRERAETAVEIADNGTTINLADSFICNNEDKTFIKATANNLRAALRRMWEEEG